MLERDIADEVMSGALRSAADRLDALARSGVELGELKHFRPAMRSGLEQALTSAGLRGLHVEQSERNLALANWWPVPGG